MNALKISFAVLATAILSQTSSIARADQASDDLAKEKQASADYLALMAKETGAQIIDGGVVLRPIFATTAEMPKVEDTVMVAYHLVDREGKLIEESITGDELAVFPLNKLIKCWQYAITKMPVGSLFKISCPSDTAYGDKGAGSDIKPGAALTFRVTLYGIQR